MKVALFAGAFHPPTRAHLAIARAALAEVDEVVFILPERFPHKQYDRVGLTARRELLLLATAAEPRFRVDVSAGSLYVEIVHDFRAREAVDLVVLMGQDAADRFFTWDYGRTDALPEMLREFSLLVAARGAEFIPPDDHRPAVRELIVPGEWDDVSSTEVRRRIQAAENWEELVPPEIVSAVRHLYR